MTDATQQDLEFVIESHYNRKRADKVVTDLVGDLSRSQVQKLFERGLVWRDEDALGKSDSVRTGDVVQVTIPAVQPMELRPVDIPLDVLFEDDDLIAVNKVPGMVTHPGVGTGEDTLVHALLHHCGGQLSGIGGVERPGIVHRLDKETSGVIIAAKSNRAFQVLAVMFAERQLEKRYLAIVKGVPSKLKGNIDAPIGRHPVQRHKMAVRPEGRQALTDYEVLQKLNGYAFVELRIHTGRTHQIRVHMSHLGHPVAGDETYGFKVNRDNGITFPRVMLHAATLKLQHPVSGEALTLTAPLPADFQKALEGVG
jgi:23S rRNA pseudouridine1911/1915/1917 synthase